MKLALLFPQFAPNLYDLGAMLRADRVILQDVEPWSRKSRVHRARIRTPDGTQWINIPVRTEDRSKPVGEVRIDHETDWIAPLLRALRFNYRNSIYYDFYEPEISAGFRKAEDHDLLLPFILTFQKRLLRFMDIYLEWTLASELKGYSSDPDELAGLLDVDILYQEYDARHYQRQSDKANAPEIEHPSYHQHFESFIAGCSLLDLLFQLGPESFRVTDKLRS